MKEKGILRGLTIQSPQCYPHHLFDRETKMPFSSATRNRPLLVFHRTTVHLAAKCGQLNTEHRPLMR